MKGSCAVLHGAVRSWAEHRDAERAARTTPGVTSVDNQLALLAKVKRLDPAQPSTTTTSLQEYHDVSDQRDGRTSWRSRVTVRGLTMSAVLASVWLLSTEPWGLGAYQLLMFTAPGALLGLGAGWMAHASVQSAWTWKSARRAAVFGAIALPPFLAFIIALDGSARPQRLLVGFVYAAWVALISGAVVALARYSSNDTSAPPVPIRRARPASPLRLSRG
jgi:hypothetical protein